MQDAKRETLLNRINKLLQFDESNATKEEAARAAEKVQELLQRYNLDMSEVRRNGPKVNLVIRMVDLPTARLWAKNLMGVLCRFNFCDCMFYRRSKHITVYGEAVNVEAVVTMFNHLTDAATMICTTTWTRYIELCEQQHKSPIHRSAFNADFFQGINDAIFYRLDKQAKEFAARSNTNRALVVTNKEELKAFEKEQFGKVKIVNTRHNSDSRIYQAGIAAGALIELNKLVTEGK